VGVVDDDVELTSLDEDARVLVETDTFSLRVSKDLLRPFKNKQLFRLHIW